MMNYRAPLPPPQEPRPQRRDQTSPVPNYDPEQLASFPNQALENRRDPSGRVPIQRGHVSSMPQTGREPRDQNRGQPQRMPAQPVAPSSMPSRGPQAPYPSHSQAPAHPAQRQRQQSVVPSGNHGCGRPSSVPAQSAIPQQRCQTGAYPAAAQGHPSQNGTPQIVVNHAAPAASPPQSAHQQRQPAPEASTPHNVISRETNYKKCTIRTIDGTTIHGNVNISGLRRLSDLFTSDRNTFIVMVDVRMGGGRGKTIFVNKDHIVWVEPLDEDPKPAP